MSDLRDSICKRLDEIPSAWLTTEDRDQLADDILALVREASRPSADSTSMYVTLPEGYRMEPAVTTETVYQMCGCRVVVEHGQLVVDTCARHTPKPRATPPRPEAIAEPEEFRTL